MRRGGRSSVRGVGLPYLLLEAGFSQASESADVSRACHRVPMPPGLRLGPSLLQSHPLLSGRSPVVLAPTPASVSCSSIRQYELMVHADIDTAKVYVGEMGRLKSYESQKP
jgi:hypothetical protein